VQTVLVRYSQNRLAAPGTPSSRKLIVSVACASSVTTSIRQNSAVPTLFLLSPRTRSKSRKLTSTAPVPLATRISGIFIAFPPLPALPHKANSPYFIQYLSVLYTLLARLGRKKAAAQQFVQQPLRDHPLQFSQAQSFAEIHFLQKT